VETLHRREALELVVIDALAALLPGYAETCAPKLLDCLLPVQALAAAGPAVWLLHHPAKAKRIDGQSARGSGALSGLADILMEMSCVRRARSRDRRRRICAYSRYDETPRHKIIELDAAGADYLVRNDTAGTPVVGVWPEVHYILEHTDKKLTLHAILEQWPAAEHDPPERSTLSRWLKRAVQQGLVLREGTGYRDDPHRYWLSESELYLWPGRNAPYEEQQAWRLRCFEREQDRRVAQGLPRIKL
jgi:hypothetical protein